MPAIPKRRSGFTSFHQGTDCFACVFFHDSHTAETAENEPIGYLPWDVGGKPPFDWLPTGLHV